MKARFFSLACVLLAASALAACGGTTTSTTTNAAGQKVVSCHIAFAKTKFLLHAGLAIGAFHRYIYTPFRAGTFKKGVAGRTKALVKAAASALFIFHELKIASQDAKCDGPTLRQLASPVSSAIGALTSLAATLKAGNLGGIAGATGLLDGLASQASQFGLKLNGASQ